MCQIRIIRQYWYSQKVPAWIIRLWCNSKKAVSKLAALSTLSLSKWVELRQIELIHSKISNGNNFPSFRSWRNEKQITCEFFTVRSTIRRRFLEQQQILDDAIPLLDDDQLGDCLWCLVSTSNDDGTRRERRAVRQSRQKSHRRTRWLSWSHVGRPIKTYEA